MKNLYLHIGTHKTGTTAIQTFAYNHRDTLLSRGLLYPDYFPLDNTKTALSHHAFFRALINNDEDMTLSQAKKLIRKWTSDANKKNVDLFLSAESICVHKKGDGNLLERRKQYFMLLKELFSEFNVHVVLVLRRPDDYVRSAYQEKVLKHFGSDVYSFPEFREMSLRPGMMLHYFESIEMIRSVFSSVICLIFEDLIKKDDLAHHFFSALGFDFNDLTPEGIVRDSLSLPETQLKIFACPYIKNTWQNTAFLNWMRSKQISTIMTSLYENNAYDLWESSAARVAFMDNRANDLAMVQQRLFPDRLVLFPPLPLKEYPIIPPLPEYLKKMTIDFLTANKKRIKPRIPKFRDLFQLLKLYISGLERTMVVINQGDVPSWRVTSKAEKKYPYPKFSFLRRLKFFLYLSSTVLSRSSKIFDLKETDVIYCGNTKNNIKEFEFLDRFINTSFPTYSDNINLLLTEKIKRSETANGWALRFLCVLACAYKSLIYKINPTSTQYIISYTTNFLMTYRTFLDPSRKRPKLAVMANDHHYDSIAFSKVMEYLGVPRVYLQHAEVSDKFPPLDFEISILRNQISRETYDAIKTITIEPYIISRFPISDGFSKLNGAPPLTVNAVIYLSAVFDIPRVVQLIESLRSNQNIISVSIKKHPGTKPEQLIDLVGVDVHDSVPPFHHVAIVPNSSVVIELLHAGIPVFQYFGLDQVTADYYGFVKTGITTELSQFDLANRFWTSATYDSVWLAAYSRYNPAASPCQHDEQLRLTQRLSDILSL